MIDSFYAGTMYEFELRRKYWQKAMTTDWKAKYNAEMCTSEIEKKNKQKNKNRHKENFEDEANNMRYDKEDTQRSNLNNIYI